MSQPTKPSAGALRAAEYINKNIFNHKPGDIESLAQAIDRETGVAELLEAAKFALSFVDHPSQLRADALASYDRLSQAIAKCEEE